MTSNNLSKRKLIFLSLCYFIYTHISTYSQCAGSDNTITICDKELDINYKNFNLFNILNGNPDTGGLWTSENPLNEIALNKQTGIVNLWKINRSGIHNFTYINDSCNASATVTIELGGYTGENNMDGGANVCNFKLDANADLRVNLFTFLDNDDPDLTADINGEWTADSNAAPHLSGNIFDPKTAGVGIYEFTYTIEAVGSCFEKTSTVILEVHRFPNSGEASSLVICGKDDLSDYTEYNLFDLLLGEDTNGIWSESFTSQISSLNDSTINIQEIYDNFGNGEYNFTYAVYPTHGVCEPSFSTVTIFITDVSVNFSLPTDSCSIPNDISIDVDYKFSPVPIDLDIIYDLSYQITNTYTQELIDSNTISNISDQQLNLPISPSPILEPGTYQIEITNIEITNGTLCGNFNLNSSQFTYYSPGETTLNGSECYQKDDVININLNEHTEENGELINGTKSINYNINYVDTDNTTQNVNTTKDLIFNNGNSTLTINLTDFNIDNGQSYNFALNFFNENNNSLKCTTYNFPVAIVPEDTIKLSLEVDNFCDATEMEVIVEAQLLSSGSYTVTYDVLKTDSSEVLINNKINFFGGDVNYNVDISGLEDGDYKVILKSVQDDNTPCRSKFEFELTEYFSIGTIIATPTVTEDQNFCFSNYLPNGPTIEDIIIDSGNNLSWYADLSTTETLTTNTILEDGEDYYVTSKSNLDCGESSRVIVNTFIYKTETVIVNPTQTFCAVNTTPTLVDIDVFTKNDGEIIWFSNNNTTEELSENTVISDSTTYYVAERNGVCSSDRTPVTTIIIKPNTPEFNGTTTLCKLDNPIIETLEKDIPFDDNYKLVWYDAKDGGNELDIFTPLEHNINYYVAYWHEDSNCESNRLEITPSLNNCTEGFFIPDGFSPNNDSVNDEFYIPNIQYFYPDYEYEIFNRYGQLVFKGNIDNPNWDGTDKTSSKEVTSGVYFYILKYNRYDLKPVQGRIYLSK